MRDDPEIQAALAGGARPTGSPSRPGPLGATIRAGAARRGGARRPGLRPRAARPARHRAAPRRALMPLVAGVDSSTSSCKVEVRDADTGELVVGRAGAAPAHDAAPQRAGPARLVGGLRGGVRRRPACLGARPSGGRSPSPASSTASSCSTPTARCSVRPSCGTTPSRPPTPTRCVDRSPGGAAAWAARLRQRPGRQLHHHQARVAAPHASPRSARASRRVAAPPRLAHRAAHRAGRRPTGATPPAPAGGRPAEERYRLDLLALVDDARDWERDAPRGARRPPSRPGEWGDGRWSSGRARATTWPPPSGSGCGPATSRSASAPAAPPSRVSDRPSADAVGHRRRVRRRHRPLPAARLHAQRRRR